MTVADPAQRVRQAAIGCTIHPHGPLNALAAVVEGHIAGAFDGHIALAKVMDTCRRRLLTLDPDSLDARREEKVLLVVSCVDRGLP